MLFKALRVTKTTSASTLLASLVSPSRIVRLLSVPVGVVSLAFI